MGEPKWIAIKLQLHKQIRTQLKKSSSAAMCGSDSLSESSFATAVCNIRLFMKVAI